MRNLATMLAAALALFGATAAMAQIPTPGEGDYQPPPDPRWAAITASDVDGAYRFLRDNHPGAAPELHDIAFQQRLERAHAAALARARTAVSYRGYMFTLSGFANAMGDKHIWSRPTFVENTPLWAGIIVSKREQAWVVTDTDDFQTALTGATLIECDGQPVERLAETNLGGFHADWTVAAQQTQNAGWLLVDEGNPFIQRPRACVFDKGGARQTVTLAWTRIKRDNLLPKIKKAGGAGAAGFQLRKVGDGYWIALQDLADPRADALVETVQAQAAALRQAPFVVLDLRGNGGGSSIIGREIARALMGPAVVDRMIGPDSGDDTCYGWRASEGNLRNLAFLKDYMAAKAGAEATAAIDHQLQLMRAAHAAGHVFSGNLACASQAAEATPVSTAVPAQPPSLMRGRLIVVTDNLCFSSCLSVVDNFRTLGAFQIGQTTDAATHFTEVREDYLPSGYSMFSTLQAVYPKAPEQFGPFAPYLSYTGDIADTPSLETWVVKTALPASLGATGPSTRPTL